MPLWTCEQCGAQFPERAAPPASCPICEDERQYVNWKGQQWLTREALAERYKVVWRDDLGVSGVGLDPGFAIGQRALIIPERDGCVMWDCIPLATSEAVAHVRSLGGLKAIAVSHPHFYGAVDAQACGLRLLYAAYHAAQREGLAGKGAGFYRQPQGLHPFERTDDATGEVC